MSKYRKKPVVIEAQRWAGDNAAEIVNWASGAVMYIGGVLGIQTLEGTMTASIGDYVICGVQGEFYPCKPDIFKATYEAVEDDS
jgi:hypothetical protein